MRGNQFGGVLQVLFKAELKSLTDGADDLLSQALWAFEDMTRYNIGSDEQISDIV